MLPGPERSTRSRRAATLSTIAGVGIGLVTVGFVVQTLASEWTRSRDAIVEADPGWLLLAFVLAGLGMSSIAWAWDDVLGILGGKVGRGRALAWYYIGELGKYLPGGVWPLVGRGEMARRGGVPRSRAYASVALSLVTLYLAAMLVAIGLLPFALTGDRPGSITVVLALLPLGLAALHPRVLAPAVALVERLARRRLAVTIPSWKATVGVVLRYVPTWLLVGGSTWAVARAVTPDPSLPRVAFAAVLSWIVGFLAVPVPAGAGVREAVFVAACGLASGPGAVVAVTTRVLFVAVDALGAAISAPVLRRSGSGGKGVSARAEDEDHGGQERSGRPADGLGGSGEPAGRS